MSKNWWNKDKETKPKFGCTKCNRSLEALQDLKLAKFCGDYWKCTVCNNDITRNLNEWFVEVMANAEMLWNTKVSEAEEFWDGV